eukprot:TRINITY_DN3459_c0_g1_i2.p1 TRINITY_DN3459_c0_g1~~TRINITY_DN3459_c0_g1_i2.p1  ORF type:complete len:387 (+),score=198.01 TRINITY_DN3459_c0_g1_i2:57-1217(+)
MPGDAQGGPVKAMRLTAPIAPALLQPTHTARQSTLASNEHDRLARVLDPKVRTIGIDRQVLDQQVAEMNERKALAAAAEDWDDRKRVQQDHHQVALQEEASLARRKAAEDVQRYRDTFQKRTMARERDLNDPLAKLKDLPGRVGDDDPRCGASSLQRFEGEDLAAHERRVRQRAQLQEWTAEQLEHKAASKRREANEEEETLKRHNDTQALLHENAALMAQQQRAKRQTIADYNKQAAEAKRREAAEAKALEGQKNLEEIQNALDSDLLTEGGEFGNRSDRMKGFAPQTMQALRADQAEQVREIRARRLAEAEREKVMAAMAEQDRVRGQMMEEQVEREKAVARGQMAAANLDQAGRHREDAAQRNRLYANEMGEQFFKPFVATTR